MSVLLTFLQVPPDPRPGDQGQNPFPIMINRNPRNGDLEPMQLGHDRVPMSTNLKQATPSINNQLRLNGGGKGRGERREVVVVVGTVYDEQVSPCKPTDASNYEGHVPVDMTPSALHLCARPQKIPFSCLRMTAETRRSVRKDVDHLDNCDCQAPRQGCRRPCRELQQQHLQTV